MTGAAADKAKAAALAKYNGSVEQVMKLNDGSYVVHVIRYDDTEVHVLVGKDFRVTGVEQGGDGRPGGDHAPSGSSSRIRNTVTITRDGVTHSTGSAMTFSRDASGRITSITNPAGKSRRPSTSRRSPASFSCPRLQA